MDNKELARLESKIDLYETEIGNLNQLLIQCGFPEGIKTLKETALELLSENASLDA